MSKKLTFQEIILTLQQYWNDQGCMLMQAYDNEKGAGTMSPYTFLRAIGPEPWNAAYVEPSRRSLRGKPKSSLPTPPIPSGHETITIKHSRTLFGVIGKIGHQPIGTRCSFR